MSIEVTDDPDLVKANYHLEQAYLAAIGAWNSAVKTGNQKAMETAADSLNAIAQAQASLPPVRTPTSAAAQELAPWLRSHPTEVLDHLLETMRRHEEEIDRLTIQVRELRRREGI